MVEKMKRKLTAILSADVEGYSRLMGENELGTIHTLKRYKQTIGKLVEKYRGRVVDAPGDNLLAEFVSVVDAVQCAVEIQREIAECNEEASQECKMNFRIGVNLGDVVEEDDRIYGDGVNIAARIESLCEGGGVCISGGAYEQVENKLKLEFEDLGEHEIKNIKKPVRIYRVRPDFGNIEHGVEPVSLKKMAFPLPEKPSIAVLPFDNMSGDPKQEYIADGISENIISALSCIPEMFVIARNSSFSYKGKPVKVQQISQELGVRYVLEGSVMKSGNKVRITAQLIDAISGGHMWSERYDRDLEDFFSLLDEITMAVAVALQGELTDGEQVQRWIGSTHNFDAWGYVVKGKSIFYKFGKQDMVKSRELFEKAVKIDPHYANALLWIAWTHKIDAHLGYTDSIEKSLKLSFDLAQKAVARNDRDPNVHSLLSLLYLIQDDHDMAVEEGRRAIDLGPSDSSAHILFGEVLYQSGKFEEAVKMCERALRQHPYPPPFYLGHTLNAYFWTERYDESLALAEKLIDLGRKVENEWGVVWGLLGSALAKIQLGRLGEARQDADKLLKIWPWFDLEYFASIYHYKDAAHLERLIDGLRQAGIPEKKPLPLPDKTSVAVLPFVNMSDDPSQDYFGDGISEDIITALSKIPELFVIARNSSFTYKGQSVKVQQIGRELGVKYILEGSVRKKGNHVRITAQLIDSATDRHLWAERYDRDLKDIFALQDEITMKIVTALRVQLMEGEHARAASTGTSNLEAYLKLLQGRELIWRFDKDDNQLARILVEEAIALDPNYANAHLWSAATHMNDVLLGSSKNPQESFSKAIDMAQKAVALDDSLSNAHSFLALLYTLTGQYDKAIMEGKRGVELGPSDEAAHRRYGVALSHVGRYDEAISRLNKAIRYNPFPRSATLFQLGIAHFFSGNCSKAVNFCEKAVQGKPDDFLSHIFLAAIYGACNRETVARATGSKLLEMDPQFSIEHADRYFKFKDAENNEKLKDGLRVAGIE